MSNAAKPDRPPRATAPTAPETASAHAVRPPMPDAPADRPADAGGIARRARGAADLPAGAPGQGARRDPDRRGARTDPAASPARSAPPANPVGVVTFPEALPVSSRREEIARAIAAHQVVIVSGETGSGKTTQLPKICLALGRGRGAGGTGLIGHTQPRRIAASATARRIADELQSPPGEIVGYKVRFNDTLSPGASVKLMTDGILLAETQSDPMLRAYDTLIIDEAHERSLNIDFLLGYLKQLLPKRPDLKVIVTSATIDAARFARHFGRPRRPGESSPQPMTNVSAEGAPTRSVKSAQDRDGRPVAPEDDIIPAPAIEVSGRLYPVEIRYRPVQPDGMGPAGVAAKGDTKAQPGEGRRTPTNAQREAAGDSARGTRRAERDLIDAIVDAVDELARVGSGDVLVFLPGEREIREAAEALRKHHPPHTEILPLFARLSAAEQERVFKPSNARRIVLATNVAETSLTVPGIRYVVDTGLARVKRYSYRNKVEQLQVEPASQAAANQRAGRCGRVADGVCIRLYDEADFQSRPRFTDPEILRSSLASVILRMKSLHLTDIETFPFLEAPTGRAIADGYQLLAELGAVDDDNRLTKLGRELARLPLDPRVGRMILAGRDSGALREMLIIASALSVQDPRDRPLEAQEAADQAHRQFADERSEFLVWLNIWKWFTEAVEHKKTNRQLIDQCRARFLSHLRLREWRDVHTQLLTVAREQGWRLGEAAATYEQVHLALLAGLLGNIGMRAEDEPHYLGARSIKFHLWPGSTLGKKAGKWIIAAEMIETTRLYARCVARVEPEWIEKVGSHLLRTSLSEPHWEKKAAQVVAFERATLYGLPIYQRRRVDFGKRDPARARELFIRGALVEGEFDTRLPFFAHNRRLLADIAQLEHKSRRQDVLVDDELIFAFYDQQIPADVCTAVDFEKWYRHAGSAVGKNGSGGKTDTEGHAGTSAEPGQPATKRLYLSRDDLMRHEAAGITTDLFPKRVAIAGQDMGLSYHFEPGSPRDGVTLTIPLFALNQVGERRCEWLVAGMLKEKVQALLKSLPQKLRRHCVPLPDYAAGFLDRHAPRVYGSGSTMVAEGLVDALCADIRALTQQSIRPSDFKLETLAAHLFMNFKLVDEHGRQLAMVRSLSTLRVEYGGQAQQQFAQIALASTVAESADDDGDNMRDARDGAGKRGLLRGNSGNVTPRLGTGTSAATAIVGNGARVSADAGASAASGTALYDNLTNWTFGKLPELLEIRRGGNTLYGYPALVDRGTHVEVQVFDSPEEAGTTHRIGLRRLFALQLREPLKYLEKNLPGLQQMAMQYMSLGTQDELRSQLLDCAIERACLVEPLPDDDAAFAVRRDEGRARLSLLAQEVSRLVATILTEYTDVSKKLAQAKSFGAPHDDMLQQLRALVGKRFIAETPYAQLSHFPRYLQGIGVRLTKLKADPQRDARASLDMAPLRTQYQRMASQWRAGSDPRLEQFRWLLEELRISLFAQELKTPMPVSVKRLHKVWDALQR
ncbi:ATP-dependent RNA helicase HrpA [Robbsia andropogonis]|uniref:ATP-dependent RNA helicase HrpA n=1 Tax=Robbsia andropogonis TaxID=28092 RepID=UPI002A69A9DC|nr:ATP-dependent RNA helicase HrpA [Robbsia andropogonis]